MTTENKEAIYIHSKPVEKKTQGNNKIPQSIPLPAPFYSKNKILEKWIKSQRNSIIIKGVK